MGGGLGEMVSPQIHRATTASSPVNGYNVHYFSPTRMRHDTIS
jgi:hypothetical protein